MSVKPVDDGAVVNVLVLDHWAGRSIDDLADECGRILADPSRMTPKVVERIVGDLLELDA